MEKLLDAELSPDETARIQNEIQHYLDEIQRSQERMQQTHQEIERSKRRTRAMLDEMRQLRAA